MRTVLSNRIARVDGCMKEGNKVVDGRTIRIKKKKKRKKKKEEKKRIQHE